jgi:hypothetical protein
MAVGRGGIRTERQLEALSARRQARFEDVLRPAANLLLSGQAPSERAALKAHLGRTPTGRDYEELHALAGRSRRDWQRLYREPMPVLTPDGVYETAPTVAWRQRSLIGRQWSLMGLERRLSDEQLSKELRGFRREEVRVVDDQGRIIRLPLESNVARFRQFARSREAQHERVISPKVGRGR